MTSKSITITRRDFLRRSSLAAVGVAGIAVAPSLLTACGDTESSLERARQQGFIRVGFANEAPYGYATAAGEVTGEAPEVARVVLSRLGIDELDGVVTTFSSLIPGLQAGRFDMIAAGMFITPDRCDAILFSDPDYCIPQAFGVEAGNPLNLLSYEDVAANPDATLGVLGGAVEEGYALDLGVSEDQLVTFDQAASMAEGLQAGRVDAFALTSLSVRTQLERLDDPGLEITPAFVPVIEGEEQVGCGGYGFREDDEEFRDAFNEVLVEMKDNDEIVPIVEEFGFTADEIDSAKGRTAAELCEE